MTDTKTMSTTTVPICTNPVCGGHEMDYAPQFGLWLCGSCGCTAQPPAMPPETSIESARSAVGIPREDLKYPENVQRLLQALSTMCAAYDVSRMERERDRLLATYVPLAALAPDEVVSETLAAYREFARAVTLSADYGHLSQDLFGHVRKLAIDLRA